MQIFCAYKRKLIATIHRLMPQKDIENKNLTGISEYTTENKQLMKAVELN